MKTLWLIVMLSLLSIFCFAGIDEYYTFNSTTTTYSPIVGTQITAISGDDYLSEAISLDFSFPYGEADYTQIKVSSNGWIGLGTAFEHSNLSNELTSTEYFPLLAPLWDDTSLSSGNAQYLLSGVSPNRVFTIQYQNMLWNYNGANSLNMQVKLWENGKIEFIYGSMIGTPNFPSASIGINMQPGGVDWFMSVTPGNPASISTNTENYTIAAFPEDGVMYQFLPVIPQPNDLAAIGVSGQSIVNVGQETTYTVLVKNRGTQSQSMYSVKLETATGIELGSTAGSLLAPSMTQAFTVQWTPATEGPISIRGKVVLMGDQNNLNDASNAIPVMVMPANILSVTIGEGNQTDFVPVDMYWKNSLFETIYYPNEMTMFGEISAIAFYNNFQSNLPNKPVKIWLGTTTLNDLSGGWLPSTQLTQVFDGTVTFPSGQNTVIVPLQNVFNYTSGNLVMMVNRPMDTQYFSYSDVFLSQTLGASRSLKVEDDNEVYNPANPPTDALLNGSFPKTTFFMSPLSPNPSFLVSPNAWDFNTVLLNSEHTRAFSVINMGGGSLGINNISISGSEFFTLQGLPAFPITLSTGQVLSFTLRYNPTIAGNHSASISINDNLPASRSISISNTRVLHTISVTANCIDHTITNLPYLQAFDAVTAPALPIQWASSVQSTDINASIALTDQEAYSAPNCVMMTNQNDPQANLLLIAPPFASNIATNTTRAKFYAKSPWGEASISIGVMTNPQDPASYTHIQTIELTTTWTEYVVSFGGYAGTGSTVAFKHGLGGQWQTIMLDNVMLEYIPQNDLAALSISGNSTPTVGIQTALSVRVFNWGSNPQSAYQVKLYGIDNTELASANGVSVLPGQTVQVPIFYTPAIEGNLSVYAKVVLATDQNNLNDTTPSFLLIVQPAGMFAFTVGEGTSTDRIPIDMYYNNSLFECLYYPAELSNTLGMITGIGFYANLYTNIGPKPTNVWLGTTTSNDLAGQWIPSTSLTQVFSGDVNYPSGENLIYIGFTEPFMYLDGGNLVLMIERPMDTQYYDYRDVFYTQTGAESRALNVFSDLIDYDPASPPEDTQVSGMFPKTTFFMIPGGVGHLSGTVVGANNQALQGVSIQFTTGGYSAVTDAQGQYQIINIIDGEYEVTFSKYGYLSQVHNITIPEDETVIQNVNMQPMATVTVTGTVIASDTGLGLAGAALYLSGYQSYNVNSNAVGSFTFPSVYANQQYSYTILCPGFTSVTGTINVGSTNTNMGTITLNEIAYAPHAIQALVNSTYSAVDIAWLAPDPASVEITESFEDPAFPPLEWTQVITNTGTINPVGVYPTWCRFANLSSGGLPIVPTDGSYQAGLWWSYAHQDEWLKTPSFNCPPDAYLKLDSYVYYGSTHGDHHYIKVTSNSGGTWEVLWDASTQTGGWNHYNAPITVDLSMYSGLEIQIAFHAEDSTDNQGLWYEWLIDKLYIGNAVSSLNLTAGLLNPRYVYPIINQTTYGISTPTSSASGKDKQDYRISPQREYSNSITERVRTRRSRFLVGYKVWRLIAGQESNEVSWVALTPEIITDLNLTDNAWTSLPNGTYRWAVKAFYTAGVTSGASFSNPVLKAQQFGNVVGFVRRTNNAPVVGATIAAGTFSTTSNSQGAYSLILPIGLYNVTFTATGYNPRTMNDILVSPNQNTTLNVIMISTANEDELNPVTATALKGNLPNPFNPETTIYYDILDPCMVSIEVYNVKGQKVRTLVNENMLSGRFNIVFNGKDDQGKSLSSGVYFYRFKAGKYVVTNKMMLMQ